MRKHLALVILASVLTVAFAALAYEVPLGVLASSGSSINNTSTAAPFSFGSGVRLAIQCDADSCVRACTNGSSCSVTCTLGQSNTGTKLSAGMLFDVPTDSSVNAVASIPVSGSSNCQVFQVK